MSQQQTLLRAKINNDADIIEYQYLDLYSDIPIKINKSFAELQDISKRNSDYSVGLTLPGSKSNNQFFESFYNVDTEGLYFNPNKRVEISVIAANEPQFVGYMRLNSVKVLNSQIEYDVTLYSNVGDLFGNIGNNLLRDLDFTTTDYPFNHTFSYSAVTELFYYSNFVRNDVKPHPYFYPIIHNGYNYENVSGATLPLLSGSPIEDQTRLYTSTAPIAAYSSTTQAYTAGVKEYYINSPIFGLRNNQLKPALNVYSLIQLMFNSYGYTIKSDFFNTPWFKTMYLYGYYSSDATKFSYKVNNIETLPIESCEIVFASSGTGATGNAIVTKKGTGIPCYCLQDINVTLIWYLIPLPIYFDGAVISAGTSGYTATVDGWTFDATNSQSSDAAVGPPNSQKYFPVAVGDSVAFQDGDPVNFSLVIDENIKQIDFLASIAKKFDLVFIPDPDTPKQIIVEPFDFYIGTGVIYDWTPKLSYDKGFTVEPALNYTESQLTLTDLEDNDEGNRQWKIQNKLVYGQNNVYNVTDFKSEVKTIDTLFSPELVRRWDDNIGLPLGINYSATNEISSYDNQVRWVYKGIKTKPKLFFWLGGFNPFLDAVGEVYNLTNSYNTYTVKIAASNYTGSSANSFSVIPTISHTMPMGLDDQYKINNDSLCILFNSQYPVDIGVQTYNTYTENDAYNVFYNNRISNIYNPNTRFLTGYFDINYSDIKNLAPKDIIKIKEQYFIVNKISDYNITNRELTKVELVQFNVNPQTYPDRYFKYTYCDQPSYCFKLKTNFTNPNLLDTNYMWSIYYDSQVGSLTGSTTGFTGTIKTFDTGSFVERYIPYTMNEITETDYISGSCVDWNCDTLMNKTYADGAWLYTFNTFWFNSGSTKTGFNVFESCSQFNSLASTYGIITGSSTMYGPKLC